MRALLGFANSPPREIAPEDTQERFLVNAASLLGPKSLRLTPAPAKELIGELAFTSESPVIRGR